MNSGFIDPNNHVPEITPGDDWDQPDHASAKQVDAATFLPPRRSSGDSSPGFTEKVDPGLRIDTPIRLETSPDSPIRLQVQEIGSSVIRLDQGAPPPPKVERVITFQERPANLNESLETRGEALEWGQVQRGPLRWILIMGGTAAVIVLLGVFLLPAINAPNAGREDLAERPSAVDENKTPEGVAAVDGLLFRQPEAARIYRSFVQAAHPDDILPMIRDGAGLNDVLRQHWQPMRISSQWEPSPDTGWSTHARQSFPFATLAGHLPDNSKFTACFIVENDRLLLDWKATTGYGTASFPDLESGRGNGDEIRGEISMTDYYTLAFPEQTHQAFRLTSPDGQDIIWCYAPRESTVYSRITSELLPGQILWKSVESKKVTLHLVRGPDVALPNQWLIADLLHLDWVSP